MEGADQFPYEILDIEQTESDELMKYLKGEHSGFVRVGPKGYFLPKKYKEQARHIYNMPLRSDDIFVVSYPRSGSTWTRELVWLVANDLNYTASLAEPLVKRFISMEISSLFNTKLKDELLLSLKNKNDVVNMKFMEQYATPGYERLASTPSPRFIYSHLPLSLLPPALLQTCKVVYVARDPRDVVVSIYHLQKLYRVFRYDGDFKTFWNFFIKDCDYFLPYFGQVKEAWEKRLHPNMLFLFYEELSKDLPSVIRRVSSFLNKQYSAEQVAILCERLSFDNFKKRQTVNSNHLREIYGKMDDGDPSFIRKGKSGGWRDYFTEEMRQQADSWIADNLRDTDLRFPTIPSQ